MSVKGDHKWSERVGVSCRLLAGERRVGPFVRKGRGGRLQPDDELSSVDTDPGKPSGKSITTATLTWA